MRNSNIVLVLLLMATLLSGCIEPFEAETRGFEGLLVVDAKLTNESKRQLVLLSRTRPFEKDSVVPEGNAIVEISSSSGMSYSFEEIVPGRYESVNIFGAINGERYQLKIITVDGASFSSEQVETPDSNEIKDVYAEPMVKGDGDEGIGIFVDTESAASTDVFLRYEYEEDYKIIAPFWNPFDFDIIKDELCPIPLGFIVELKLNTNNNRICWGHNESTKILLANSELLSSNELSQYLVRFISKDNFVISHRYSIMIKQHSLNQAAFTYYQNLEVFSSNESVFTSAQPGFLEGNLRSANGDPKVIGYFEVSAVRSKRLFFDYEQFFPNEELPPYPINCNVGSPALVPPGAHCSTVGGISDGTLGSPLIDGIRAGIYTYHGDNPITPERLEQNDGRLGGLGPYFTVPKPCGDCTELGSNVKPEFWID